MLELIVIGIAGAWVLSFFVPDSDHDEDDGKSRFSSLGEEERANDYGAWKKRRDDMEAHYKRKEPR